MYAQSEQINSLESFNMKKSSLAFKLNISTFTLLFFIVFSGIYSIVMIKKTQFLADETGQNWMPSIHLSGEIIDQVSKYSRRLIFTLIHLAEEKEEGIHQQNVKMLETYESNIDDKLAKYSNRINSQEEQMLLNDIQKRWKEYLKASENAIALAEQKKYEIAFDEAMIKAREKVLGLEVAIEKLSNFSFEGGVASTEKGKNLTFFTMTTMSIIIITAISVTLTILFIIKKSTQSINQAVNNLKEQSTGTKKISFNLKNSSQNLADSVSEQASSVHETSAAINEITSMLNRTSENARESTNVAKSASQKAEEGLKIMGNLVNAMETIQQSNNQLQDIANIINQINSKTTVINDIVSKTELLSLNASIESARAGEYGKGFAVVAEEVGNLAKMSGKSAHEIQELITKSQEQVTKILELTKERVDEGKNVTAKAQGSFHNISENIATMANVLQQIADAAKEQELGIKQISNAMGQIDKATQNSQHSMGSTSESATELVTQSDKLDQTARDIEFLIKGTNI
jgi:methyl-accepting chemotaxis protein